MAEIAMDISEGADMIMVKPGVHVGYFASCQIIWRPSFAYQVSGEYAMLRNAVMRSVSEDAIYESLIAFKRAGADGILTYFAPLIASQMAEE